MKRVCVIIAVVLLVCESAFALKSGFFRSLEDFSLCENLLIIQVPMSYNEVPPSFEKDEPTLAYTVPIVKDLRGEHPVGEKVAVSVTKKLVPGSQYLLAGMPAMRGGKPWLLFHWELGVIEIPSTFDLGALEGKDIPAQITALLSARRDEVKKRTNELNREMEFIDRIIPNELPDQPTADDGK